MADTTSNGLVIPAPADRISATGVAEMRKLGNTADAAISTRATVTALSATDAWVQILRQYIQENGSVRGAGIVDIEQTAPGVMTVTWYDPETDVRTVETISLPAGFANLVEVSPGVWEIQSEASVIAMAQVTGLQAKLDAMQAAITVLQHDTGGRQIASSLPSYISGEFMIRRIRDTVYVSLYELQVTETSSGNPGYMIQAGFLPSGFRPALTPYLYYQGTLRNDRYTVGPFRVDRYGGVTIYDVKFGANDPKYPGQPKIMSVAVSWPTNDAWPTTLPGTPA